MQKTQGEKTGINKLIMNKKKLKKYLKKHLDVSVNVSYNSSTVTVELRLNGKTFASDTGSKYGKGDSHMGPL